jgi:outer membrane protein TolC
MRRADLQEAARQIEATAADARQAQARMRPRVALTGQISALRVSGGDGRQTGSVWSLGPLQVSFPIYDAGIRQALADNTRQQYDDALLQYRGRVRLAVREVEDALVNLQASAAREADVQQAAEGFDAAFVATEARFRAGLASVFELEDARRSAVAAQASQLAWQRERTLSWINLYRALGGGWVAPAAAALPLARTPSP